MIIQVLDHEVELLYVAEKIWTGDALGDFSEALMMIRILKDLKPDLFSITLYHELTHVKQFLFGKTEYDDEAEANQDALFWHSLRKNNRKLFAYDITKSLEYR